MASQQTNQPFSGLSAIRGAMMMTGSTYVTYGLGMLVSIVIARSLGPEDFGRYSYVVWLAGLVVVLANNGLSTSAIRFLSESLGRGVPATARRVHGWMRRRQWACMLLVGVGFVLLVPLLVPAGWGGDKLGLFVAVTLAAGLLKAWFIFDVSVAKGYGHYGIEAASTVLVSVLNIAAVLLLWWLHAGLEAYLLLFALAGGAYALTGHLLRRRARLIPARGAVDAVVLPRMRRHLYWTVLLALAWAFSNRSIETWLLNRLVGAAAVGYFAIAAALVRGGVDMLASGLATVLMPMMAHAFGAGGQARAGEIMGNAMRYFTCMGLLLAGTGALAAEPLIALLYGPAYHPVVLPLQVMFVVGGLTLAEGAFNALLSTTDNQKLRVGFVGLSLVVTAMMAVLLVPRYGLMGAVAAHACSRVLVFAAIGFGITRMMHMRLPWHELARLLAAALVAAGTGLVVLSVLPSRWAGIAAAVVYAVTLIACTVAFGAWREQDLRELGIFTARYPHLHSAVRPFLGWASGGAAGGR